MSEVRCDEPEPPVPAPFTSCAKPVPMEVEKILYPHAANFAAVTGLVVDTEVEQIPWLCELPAQDVEMHAVGQATDDLSSVFLEPVGEKANNDKKMVTPEKRAAQAQPAPFCTTPALKRLRCKTRVDHGLKPVSSPSCSPEASTSTSTSEDTERLPVCPAHIHELAELIRVRDTEAFDRLSRMKLELVKKNCPKGRVPEKLMNCHICKARKHQNKWLEKDHGVTGGLCYCCFRACVLLRCSRSPTLLESAEARPGVLEVSKAYRDWLAGRDVCKCKKCELDNKKKGV